MNIRKGTVILILLAVITSPIAIASIEPTPEPTDTPTPKKDCKVTVTWTEVEYTSGDVGVDAWRWRSHGLANGHSNGVIIDPPFDEDPATLFNGATGGINKVLVGPNAVVGKKGDPVKVKITFKARETDPGAKHPHDFSNEGEVGLGFTCTGSSPPGGIDLTGIVGIEDPGAEDCVAPCSATLTYKFKVEWDP